METNNMQKFIMSIIIIGVTLVIGIYVAVTMQTSFATKNAVVNVINESSLRPTTAGIVLVGGTQLDGVCGTLTAVYNGTGAGGILITSGNYTQTGCTVVNTTSQFILTTNWLYNYQYTWTEGTRSSNASGDLSTSLSNGSAWITILVVVGFAVIVLGLLSSGLSRAGGSGGDIFGGTSQEVAYTY